ncbi:MAG: glycosyltransferase [bacterium]
MNRPKTVAIVPALNEQETISGVVKTLRQSPLVDDVVVVTGASTDKTADLARAAGAQILDYPESKGKGQSMIYAVNRSSAPVILFVDADLRGFKIGHIEQLLMPVLSGSRAMNVGERDKGALNPISRKMPLISGERAMKREVFVGIPEWFLRGFMVEAALNFYCRSHRLRYGSVFLPGLTMKKKFEKVGWPLAIAQYIKMTFQVLWAMLVVRAARLVRRF